VDVVIAPGPSTQAGEVLAEKEGLVQRISSHEFPSLTWSDDLIGRLIRRVGS
jgi:hypothetical protein